MNPPTEDELVAYADGCLPEEAAARVEAYLKDHPEERAFVDELKRQDELLQRAFERPMLEMPPAALVKAVTGEKATVITLPPRETPGGRAKSAPAKTWERAALPMAAAIALVIGAIGGHLAASRSTVAPVDPLDVITLGQVEPNTKLANLLERSPTGDSIRVLSSDVVRRLTVVATFRDRLNRPCREFEVLGNDVGHLPLAVGLACRTTASAWVIEGAARIGTMDLASTKYQPSGLSERDALDGLLTMLGAGTAVDTAEERRMIESGWR